MDEVAETHKLYLMSIDDDSLIRSLRAIRRGLAGLKEPARLVDAKDVYNTFMEDGFAYMGSGTLDVLQHIQVRMSELDCGTAVDIDADMWSKAAETRRIHRNRNLSEEQNPSDPIKAAEAQAELDGADLSPEAWKTAIALLATSEGNPLKACATANTLKRTTGNPEVYSGAIHALVSTFFWLRQLLHDHGIEV